MEFSEDSVIVKMKNLTFNENEVKKYFSDVAIQSVLLLEGGNSSISFKVILKKKGREEVLKAIDTINSKSEVLYAEPNYQLATMMTPNDKDYINCQDNIMEAIGANKAWDLTTGNPNIVIGVMYASPQPHNYTHLLVYQGTQQTFQILDLLQLQYLHHVYW